VTGGQIESHSLHLFCLALPDYFGASGFADLAGESPEELKSGLRIKTAGNRIQELVGGRLIHPANLIPGGMGKHPSVTNAEAAGRAAGDCPGCREELRAFFGTGQPSPLTRTPDSPYLAIQADDSDSPTGKQFVTSAGNHTTIHSYRELLSEQVATYSNAKQCRADGRSWLSGHLPVLTLVLSSPPGVPRRFSMHGHSCLQLP